MKNSLYLKHFEQKSLQKIKGRLRAPSGPKGPQRAEPASGGEPPQRLEGPLVPGDYIKVGFIFKEGEKKRVQFFEGIVMAINGSHCEKKITLRKPGTYGIERIFSYNCPYIQSIKVLQSQKFRRSKLFFLRNLIGNLKKYYKK